MSKGKPKHYCLRCEPCLDELRDLKRRVRLARMALCGERSLGEDLGKAIDLLDLRRPLRRRSR